MEVYNLEPRYDSQKSFYGKAKIIKDGTNIKLQSYSTIVAEYNPLKGIMEVHGWWSNTTQRHVNEFLMQYNFSKHTKKEIENGLTLKHKR